MYIHGHYYNQLEEKISVYILTQGDRTTDIEIGGSDGVIDFTDDPVELTSQVNDTFDHLLMGQASVRLLCRDYVPGFFCNSCREAVVNIYREDTCVFAGYIEPQAYSQGYNEEQDEVELTCVDCLSALQYSNYRGIGTLGVLYSAIKAGATQRTLADIAGEIIRGVASDVDILGGTVPPLYYDGSKTLSATPDYTILSGISINELLFLGDEEDDVWTQEEVMTEILKYLDLHIVQEGLRFYLFSWATIRKGENITFRDLMQEDSSLFPLHSSLIDVQTSIVADCDCQFSLSETYNQLLLTDSVTEMENVVENPMDSSTLTHAFGNYQKYMTEYIAEGEGVKAIEAFGGMVSGSGSSWEDASQVDWYMWVKRNPLWNFYCTNPDGRRVNVYDTYCSAGTHQHKVLTECLAGGVGAALVAFGSLEKKNGGSDNSPAAAPDMKDYMVIGLHTTATADSTNLKSTYLEDGTRLKAAIPLAEYIGNTAGGTFSPADDATTNYIQISGKIALNPLMDETVDYRSGHAYSKWGKNCAYWHKTVPSRNNEDGRYYTQRFYQATTWRDEPSDCTTANASKKGRGVFPFTGTGPKSYEYDYNISGETRDTVSKVGVLQCMLIIGDKCVVENLPGNGGSGDGLPEDFTWQTYKERSECADDDEYYAQSFAIGFDPKIKDSIIGTEFDIQKNASYTIGVSVEGTMIPIHRSDQVAGQVKFYILGVVNEEWLNVTKRHKTFFRHTKYYSDGVALLDYVSSVMVRDLEVKVVSDNGKVGAVDEENDIVYMSDTKENFFNRKDDLEFKITTALTSEECANLGVNNSVKMSAPQNETTGNALLTVYDQNTATAAKPEQLYVDAYWREWHEPRVVMEQRFTDTVTRDGTTGLDLGFASLFSMASIGKTFYTQGIDRNLTDGTATVTMRERF